MSDTQRLDTRYLDSIEKAAKQSGRRRLSLSQVAAPEPPGNYRFYKASFFSSRAWFMIWWSFLICIVAPSVLNTQSRQLSNKRNVRVKKGGGTSVSRSARGLLVEEEPMQLIRTSKVLICQREKGNVKKGGSLGRRAHCRQVKASVEAARCYAELHFHPIPLCEVWVTLT